MLTLPDAFRNVAVAVTTTIPIFFPAMYSAVATPERSVVPWIVRSVPFGDDRVNATGSPGTVVPFGSVRVARITDRLRPSAVSSVRDASTLSTYWTDRRAAARDTTFVRAMSSEASL